MKNVFTVNSHIMDTEQLFCNYYFLQKYKHELLLTVTEVNWCETKLV